MKTISMIRSFLFGLTLVVTMGNTNCEGPTSDTQTGRRLKSLVSVKKIQAAPVLLPGDQILNLDLLLTQQLPNVILRTKDFALAQPASEIKASEFYDTKDGNCLIGMPQYRIGGNVNSYEWISKTGVKLGYTPAGNHSPAGVSGKVEFDKAVLDTDVAVFQGVNERAMLAAKVKPEQLKTEVSFEISFGLITIGPEFYYQTGLAALTEEALQQGLAQLRKFTDHLGWKSRVAKSNDNFVKIVGGSVDVGLQKGDRLAFYNSTYTWDSKDNVCSFAHFRDTDDGPSIAEGIVENANDFMSTVKIIQESMKEDILPGATVKLIRFAADPRTTAE